MCSSDLKAQKFILQGRIGAVVDITLNSRSMKCVNSIKIFCTISIDGAKAGAGTLHVVCVEGVRSLIYIQLYCSEVKSGS